MSSHIHRIGILGGVGAIASARFHLDLVKRWAQTKSAQTDDDFPEIIHVSRSLSLTGEGLVNPRLTQEDILLSLRRLDGCDHIAVLCNSITQHVESIPHVLTPVAACKDALKDVKRAWLLASDSTIRDRIYQNAYPQIEWIIPSVSLTPAIQQSLSHGAFSHDLGLPISGHDTVVLGCTELSTSGMHKSEWWDNAISPTDEMIRILCNQP